MPGAMPGCTYCPRNERGLINNNMQAPDLKYEFFIKDANAHWCIHDDSINITESTSDSGVTIIGVKAESIFMMARNALACKHEYSVFQELVAKPYIINSAKEMIAVLQSFVDNNTKDTDNKEENN